MSDYSIKDKCKINTNFGDENFVGIKCQDGDIQITFPLCFNIPENINENEAYSDKELRKDILLLLSVIQSTIGHSDSELLKNDAKEFRSVKFPLQAYMYLIQDFFARGYYMEREMQHKVAKRGKIDCNRTIKQLKPVVQDGNAYYLDFIVRKSAIKENELITLVHEYCVYDAFCKIGWLYTGYQPAKPRLKYNRNLFNSVVMEKLNHTFNDKNRVLFKNMLAIINGQGDNPDSDSYTYGTGRFEYVWEAMIDHLYGVPDKEEYYPKTSWSLNVESDDGEKKDDFEGSSLRPDTIMIYNHKLYVLDAKYYKFGFERKPNNLPKSADINKQITYGEYIEQADKFQSKEYTDKFDKKYIYNAFLMPYNASEAKWDSTRNTSPNNAEAYPHLHHIGSASADWKHNDKAYEKVQGILLDVKHLMNITLQVDNTANMGEIDRLSRLIEEAVSKT